MFEESRGILNSFFDWNMDFAHSSKLYNHSGQKHVEKSEKWHYNKLLF